MKIYDVIQVGYGPVGQSMAYLLGEKGYSVAVFEKWPTIFGLPRAAAFDHEIMRFFQEIGIASQVNEKIIPIKKYQWVNSTKDVLLEVPYGQADISGWENGYLMYQPNVEEQIDKKVRELSNVDIFQGWQVEGFKEFEDYIEVTVRKGTVSESGKWESTDEVQVYRTKYLLGADGANSFIRNSLNITQRDLGFGESFAVIDYKPNDPLILDHLPEAYQICNPLRPTTIIKRLGTEHIRFEFMILPGEDLATFLDEENVQQLISAWISPEDGEIIRKTMYKFSSLMTDTWKKGNIFLLGDAAHLTPPFMGQGMCSGIRDAKNLAWKLDLVLKGISDDSIFETYQTERYPHSETLVQMAIDLGKVICVTSKEAAAQRDAAFMSGEVPPMPPMPNLTDGILYKDANGELKENSGKLSFQSVVKFNDKEGLFDDVFGKGWVLYSFNEEIENHILAEQKEALNKLGVKIAILSETEKPGLIYDFNNQYKKFFENNKIETALVRPDYYLFGAVDDAAEVKDLIGSLLAQLAIKAEILG